MSIIYEAKCTECDEELHVATVKLDGGDDLCITIEPCQDCMKQARDDEAEKVRAEYNE